MDDFTIATLQESKNEWCARLINILTPLIIEGFKSIYDESNKLCTSNGEHDKVLMTFQNLITRIPKWNSSIIKTECERITSRSNCNYLEDLISCVHVIQLKVLTCIRVGNKQKKIDINIPKLDSFVHSCYIYSARKMYSNVYLYDTNVHSLQIQKHKREMEVIIQECILNAIRDSLPIEDILRNYMDETEEEDVVETIEEEKIVSKEPIIETATISASTDITEDVKNEIKQTIENRTKEVINPNVNTSNRPGSISFNNNDEVLTHTDEKTLVNVPKTIENLDKIQLEKKNDYDSDNNDNDDDDYDSDDNYDMPRLHIGRDDVHLGDLDVHNVNDRVRIEPDVILDDVQILS